MKRQFSLSSNFILRVESSTVINSMTILSKQHPNIFISSCTIYQWYHPSILKRHWWNLALSTPCFPTLYFLLQHTKNYTEVKGTLEFNSICRFDMQRNVIYDQNLNIPNSHISIIVFLNVLIMNLSPSNDDSAYKVNKVYLLVLFNWLVFCFWTKNHFSKCYVFAPIN